jgi:hypothetical protein
VLLGVDEMGVMEVRCSDLFLLVGCHRASPGDHLDDARLAVSSNSKSIYAARLYGPTGLQWRCW